MPITYYPTRAGVRAFKAMFSFAGQSKTRDTSRPHRPCARKGCDKMTRTNAAFCSAECHAADKAERKENK